MNKNRKTGIYFGLWLAVYLTVQSFFMADHLTAGSVLKSVVTSLIGGAIGGFLYTMILKKWPA